MITEDVRDDIKEILVDEYVQLLELYHTFESCNELDYARSTKLLMTEVDILGCKLIGCDISPLALRIFYK